MITGGLCSTVPFRTMQDFKDLRVWQHARVVAQAVYRHTREFPVTERYGLVAQMRRAAVSVCANIAEGCGRRTRRDLLRFLYIAEGSACELECEVVLSGDLGYLDPEAQAELESSIIAGKRMLGALIRRVQRMASSPVPPMTDHR